MTRILRVIAWVLIPLCSLSEAGAVDIPSELAARVGEGQSLPVWVRFIDKGPLQHDPPALRAAAEDLSNRALRRRAKLRSTDHLVDWRDLPIAPEYLDALAAAGISPRVESRWLNAASFVVDEAALSRLAEFPFVHSILPVARSATVRKPESLRPAGKARDAEYGGSYGELQQIRVPEVHAMGYRGQGVVIGMLDTGCSTAHEALQDAVILGVWDFINDDGVIHDQPGDLPNQDHHGSRTFSSLAAHKPGSMLGVAYEASYFLAKTEDEGAEYPAEEDFWVAGLEWLEAQGCDLVNSSVGYHDWYGYDDLDGETAACTVAADHAASLGMLVVAAVGNERFDFGHMIAPSDGDSVLAVGAVGEDGDFSWFSSPGPTYDGRIKPDLMARGEDNFLIDPSGWSTYQEDDGTSYCTTLSTGVAALLLCAHPELGPMEIIEAMRQTGDHADYPDNDYGWGLIDAVAAVEYYLPSIDHEPLPDSEEMGEDYLAEAVITLRQGTIASAEMHFRVNEGEWEVLPMADLGYGNYEAPIPAQAWESEVDYYILAESSLGHVATHPSGAPAAWHRFHVGQDLEAPVIEHDALGDQAAPFWPALVQARVRDNLAVASVHCESWLNDQRQPDFALALRSADLYSAEFPFLVENGDSIRYRIVAIDASQAANSASHPDSGEHVFAIRSEGLVLLIEEWDPPTAAEFKLGADKTPLHTEGERHFSESADRIEGALVDGGFLVVRREVAETDPENWGDYDLLVLSTSDSQNPLAPAGLPEALESYCESGGRLLCEGGELAYHFREDTGFLSRVLRVSGWLADYGSYMDLADPEHPLANVPFTIPSPLYLDYEDYRDQDVARPAFNASLIYSAHNYPYEGGIIAYDDDPFRNGGQSVYLAFNLGRVQEATAQSLVRNAAAWLLGDFTEGSGAVSGNCVLVDQGDASGVRVELTGQEPWTTGPDGAFQFANLWEGNVLLHAEREGYAAVDSLLSLSAGQIIDGLVLEMQPVFVLDYLAEPGRPIPDDYPPGIIDTIIVPEGGDLIALSVDMEIYHPFIGDLILRLISPSGTQVLLHNRSGGGADDLVGTYAENLIPVESLTTFEGEPIQGLWRLWVSDRASEDQGLLQSWGLHITVGALSTQAPAPVPDFGISGNWPNPFNPVTRIEFSLDGESTVRLEIFDLRGRRLVGLVDETLAAGTYSVLWHGTDRGGRPLSSGVYFARLSAGEQVDVRKMILLK